MRSDTTTTTAPVAHTFAHWHIPPQLARELPWARVQSVGSRGAKDGQVRIATLKLPSGPYLSWHLLAADPWLFGRRAPPGAVAGADIGEASRPLLSARRHAAGEPADLPNVWPGWVFDIEAVAAAELSVPWDLALGRDEKPD